jgi:hypothetical protein
MTCTGIFLYFALPCNTWRDVRRIGWTEWRVPTAWPSDFQLSSQGHKNRPWLRTRRHGCHDSNVVWVIRSHRQSYRVLPAPFLIYRKLFLPGSTKSQHGCHSLPTEQWVMSTACTVNSLWQSYLCIISRLTVTEISTFQEKIKRVSSQLCSFTLHLKHTKLNCCRCPSLKSAVGKSTQRLIKEYGHSCSYVLNEFFDK